jgi:thioester reductase-like protein
VPVPEAYVQPEIVAPGRGYDHAKWVIERVLELASNETPLLPVIFRVGQVAGGPNGFWKSWEWLPSIVQTGKTLGCLPFSEQVSRLFALESDS